MAGRAHGSADLGEYQGIRRDYLIEEYGRGSAYHRHTESRRIPGRTTAYDAQPGFAHSVASTASGSVLIAEMSNCRVPFVDSAFR